MDLSLLNKQIKALEKNKIEKSSDFPSINEIEENNLYYLNLFDIVDNDPTKTNTGMKFANPGYITWDFEQKTWLNVEREMNEEDEPIIKQFTDNHGAEHSETMSCKEIITAKLKELGADGLCGENCGCPIDDLCPCSENCLDCVPAQKKKCKNCEYEEFVPLEEK